MGDFEEVVKRDMVFKFEKDSGAGSGLTEPAKKKRVTICYARISTPGQKLSRQTDAFKELEYKDMVVIEEIYTGTSSDRPKWKRILRAVKRNEVERIVFDEVSRMSRDAKEGFDTYKWLLSHDVELVFLRQPHINTATYQQAINNQLQVSFKSGDKIADDFIGVVLGALNSFTLKLIDRQIQFAFEESEYEVRMLRERTKAGLAAARLRGSQLGRPKGSKVVTKKQKRAKSKILKKYRLFGGECTATECIAMCKISRDTFYRYLEQLLKEGHKTVADYEPLAIDKGEVNFFAKNGFNVES